MLHGLRRRASGHRHLLTGSAALVLTAGVQALSGRAVLADRGTRRRADRRRPCHRAVHLGAVRRVRGRPRPAGGRRPLRGRPHPRRPRALRLGRQRHRRRRRRSFGVAYLLVVSPPAVDELRDWHGAVGPVALRRSCASGTALSLLLDVRLMTQRRWGLVLAAGVRRGVRPVPAARSSPSTDDRAVWLLAVAAAAHRGVGLRRHRVAPEGHRPPPRVRSEARDAPGRGRATRW